MGKSALRFRDFFIESGNLQGWAVAKTILFPLISTLSKVSNHFKKEIILSIHPRTKNRLEKSSLIDKIGNLRLLPPFGFFDYINLQINSFC